MMVNQCEVNGIDQSVKGYRADSKGLGLSELRDTVYKGRRPRTIETHLPKIVQEHSDDSSRKPRKTSKDLQESAHLSQGQRSGWTTSNPVEHQGSPELGQNTPG